MLDRLQCTLSPRINRHNGKGAVGSRHCQPESTAPSATQLLSGTAEGGLAVPHTSERLHGISPVHDRLYRAALLSRQRLNAVVRSAEQARCP